jgi:ribosomal protein S18 acetylase RimI-like enzyme
LSAPQIKRAVPDDWEVVRDVRLAALQEAPYAFGSTFEREREFDEQRWRDWIGAADNNAGVVLLAFVDDQPVGMDGAFIDESGRAHLIAMWVEPTARRMGVGAALTSAVVAWSQEVGAPATVLDVAEDNAAARELYESLGFRGTGESRPLRSDPSRSSVEMVRDN